MGMDVAEIVMEIEDKYAISIPEEEASVKTIGEFAAYVRFRLSEERAPRRCFTSFCFFRLRSALRQALENPKQRLRTGDAVAEIAEGRDRSELYAKTRVALGPLSHTLPELISYHDAVRVFLSVMVALGYCLFMFLTSGLQGKVLFVLFSGFGIASMLSMCWAWRTRVDFPPGLATLGEVATYMAKQLTPEDMDGYLPALPSDQQILLEIRELVSKSLSMPLEKVTADANLMDLG